MKTLVATIFALFTIAALACGAPAQASCPVPSLPSVEVGEVFEYEYSHDTGLEGVTLPVLEFGELCEYEYWSTDTSQAE